MTLNHGEMRQTYPDAGDVYRYQSQEREGLFTFTLPAAADASETAVTLTIDSREAGEGLCRIQSGRSILFAWAWVGPELHLWLDGDLFLFQRPQPRRRGSAQAADAPGDILAPMPGAILEVLVSEGDRVEQNQTVVIMESMKMELVITAPRDGIVRRMSVEPGQQVERGMRLLELGPADANEGSG